MKNHEQSNKPETVHERNLRVKGALDGIYAGVEKNGKPTTTEVSWNEKRKPKPASGFRKVLRKTVGYEPKRSDGSDEMERVSAEISGHKIVTQTGAIEMFKDVIGPEGIQHPYMLNGSVLDPETGNGIEFYIAIENAYPYEGVPFAAVKGEGDKEWKLISADEGIDLVYGVLAGEHSSTGSHN